MPQICWYTEVYECVCKLVFYLILKPKTHLDVEDIEYCRNMMRQEGVDIEDDDDEKECYNMVDNYKDDNVVL